MSRFNSVAAGVMLCAAVGLCRAGCFVSTTGIAFGPYDVSDRLPRDSIMMLNVTCDDPTAHDLSITVGPSATSGDTQTRQLQGPGNDRLRYNLFIDPSRTQVWGDGTRAAPVTAQAVGRSSPRQLVLYGRIPPGQDVTPGTYSDSVIVTVDLVK